MGSASTVLLGMAFSGMALMEACQR